MAFDFFVPAHAGFEAVLVEPDTEARPSEAIMDSAGGGCVGIAIAEEAIVVFVRHRLTQAGPRASARDASQASRRFPPAPRIPVRGWSFPPRRNCRRSQTPSNPRSRR